MDKERLIHNIHRNMHLYPFLGVNKLMIGRL
jgi:hypothetical protein